MPLSYRIDADAGMLLIVGEGFITQPERIEAFKDRRAALGWLRHEEPLP